MSDKKDEVSEEISHLCDLMEIDQNMIRYVWINNAEFIGETLSIEFDEDDDIIDDVSLDFVPDNETTYFHPMKINIDVFMSDEGTLETNKYFSDLCPYSPQPFQTFKNYDILTQAPIYPSLMLEYLRVVYNSYFDTTDSIDDTIKITIPAKKSNVVRFSDYYKKKEINPS